MSEYKIPGDIVVSLEDLLFEVRTLNKGLADVLLGTEESISDMAFIRFPYVLQMSQVALPGFSTLDEDMIVSIDDFVRRIQDYKDDNTRLRPYNILMKAKPGSGKSYFVKCLAKRLNIHPVIGNLSSPDSTDVLRSVVNEARNHKAEDRLPLLFLDEVDSDSSLIPFLLPLLWDGELFIAGQVLKIGRCVIICAISDPEWIKMAESNDQDTQAIEVKKLSDLLSRFDGGAFAISSIDSPTRRHDKLCVAAELIKRRFPDIHAVSIGLLEFLASVPLQHEVRSIEFFVNLIPRTSLRHVFGLVQLPEERTEYVYLRLGRDTSDFAKQKLLGIDISDSDLNDKFSSLLSDWLPTNPLLFHITKQNREMATKLWSTLKQNTKLVLIKELPR